jgi:hypothetical protein
VARSFGIKRLVTLESIQSRGKTISCSIRFSKSKRTFSNVTESIGISNRKVNILGGGTNMRREEGGRQTSTSIFSKEIPFFGGGEGLDDEEEEEGDPDGVTLMVSMPGPAGLNWFVGPHIAAAAAAAVALDCVADEVVDFSAKSIPSCQ